jgi:ABC-type antimicrobial peptide transport system permease subunit
VIANYFKIAFRGFRRHKLFTLINVIGLSIGISAALVIYLIIHFDFTFDKSHKDGDRIYRVVTNFSFSGSPAYNPGVCGPLPGAAKREVTGLEDMAPLFRLLSQPNVHIPTKSGRPAVFKLQDDITLAGAGYFNLFQYHWLAGSAKSALNQPYQVVLTDEQARKYFPGIAWDQMIGRTVIYDTIPTTVTGIVQTLSQNTDLNFHDFISYATAFANNDLKAGLRLNNWGGTSPESQLFVRLSPKTTPGHIEKQLNDILIRNRPEAAANGRTQQFHLQPLADIHFNPDYGTFSGRVADKTTLYELLAIALFLLLLGCINFINLTTAQSVQRAKEIGIRKTMGGSRRQLILQFLSETFFMTLLSVMISIALVPLILQCFAGFIPAGVRASLVSQPDTMAFLAALTIIVSLLSGFYPALVLSGYKPVEVLKNQAPANGSKTRNALLRKSLTVSQFVIAQFFIMCTILVSKQIHYALHKDLGFKKEAVVIVNSPWKNREPGRNQVFMNRLQALPQVALVSAGRDAPASDDPHSTEGTYRDGKKEIKIEDLGEKFGDENYIKVYHIKLLAGRNLRPGDISKGFLINRTLARRIGFEDPRDAVGKEIDHFNGDTKMQIVGVVSDFYQESIHAPVAPLAILTSTNRYFNGTFHIALKPQTANGEEWKTAITGMQKAWKEIYPDDDFEYHFFDETIARLYATERHTSILLTYATVLSILISCLGLLGLAIYTTNQRTKEIGIRKVLGASIFQIMLLLSTEMISLILLAFIIVTPIAFWAMIQWMRGFADHTAISWWVFALSGTGMLLTALCTSGFQMVKAALTNPAQSLKTEG